MKNVLMVTVLLLTASIVTSQNMQYPEVPYIEVTGSADIEIEPDEIRLSITISDYEKEVKEQKNKENKNEKENKEVVKLEEVDKKLMSVLSGAGVAKKNIILTNASTESYWHYWWQYGYNDVRITRKYVVIFPNYTQLNNVLSMLPGPKEGFVNVYISDLKNKKITEYREQTKIEAVKAAKNKARYLAESVGNTIGKTLYIIELDEDDWSGRFQPYGNNAFSNSISQVSLRGEDSDQGENPAMQKIKLRYRIKARFEIK